METQSRAPRPSDPPRAKLVTSGCTVVLGLGNPILCDDGIGLAVARELRRLLDRKPIHGVDVLVSARAGFDLIELLRGYARALILDCLDLPNPMPGRVHRLGLEHVGGCARLIGMHDIGVAGAFQLAARLGVPMPAEVEIVAIEGEDIRSIAEELTPSLQAVIQPLAQRLHEDLLQRTPKTELVDDEEFRIRRALYSPEA